MNLKKKRKINLFLAVLMSAAILMSACDKTEGDVPTETNVITQATEPALTQMTVEETTTEEVNEPETTTEEVTTEAETTQEETTAETTVAESTEATTTVAESTETTTAAPAWNETKIVEDKYVTQNCYSRKEAIVGAQTVDQLAKGDKVIIVAATDTGYYKLESGAFVHGDYLSDTKPAETVTTTKPVTPTGGNTTNKPATGSSTYNIDYTTRYGYKTLSANEQTLYGNIVNAATNFDAYATVPAGLSANSVLKVYGLVFNQEPQLFWLSSSVSATTGTFKIPYGMTASEVPAIQEQIDANVATVMAAANSYSSTFNKVKIFYDWIINNNTFGKSVSHKTMSIYNGLRVGGDLQCNGYAKSMLYLCDLAGIDAMTVVGTNAEGASHAWNVIYCDNGYYNLDATWGDPSADDDIKYSFFLVPDAWIKNDHTNVNLLLNGGNAIHYFTPPACTKTACNYFKAYNLEYSTLDSATQGMYDELSNVIKSGKRVAQIRVTDINVYNTLVSTNYWSTFQKYAKSKSSNVSGLARQTTYLDGVMVVQYDVKYK